MNTLSPAEQMAMAGRLNEARRDESEEQAETEANPEEQSLREAKMASMADEGKKSKLGKVKEKASAAAQTASGMGLRWAWTVLVPSWGLSLIYINMHAFLRLVFPSAFCKLGDEWVPKKTFGEHSATNIAGTAFGIVEIMGLLLIDILAFFIIFTFFACLAWLSDNIIFNAVYKIWQWVS